MKRKSPFPTPQARLDRVPSDFYWMAGIFFLVFSVYLITLCPCFMDDDSAESITAGVTLGLAHPPGYPVAALLNRLMSLVPLGGPCFSIDLGSVLFATLAVLLFAWILRLVLLKIFIRSDFSRSTILPLPAWLCVFSASLLLAFSKTYWQKAISAKGGLYIVEMLILLGILFCLLKTELADDSHPPKQWTVLAFFLMGLGLSHDWETQIIFLPAFILFFILDKKKFSSISVFLKKTAQRLSFALVGLSVIGLYLPLRAKLQPALNLGDPENWTYFKLTLCRHYTQGREISLPKTFWNWVIGINSWAHVQELWVSMMKNQNSEIPIHLMADIKLGACVLALLGLFVWARKREGHRSLLWMLVYLACLLAAFYTTRVIDSTNSRWMVDNFLLPWNWIFALLAGVGFWQLQPFSLSRRVAGPARIYLKVLWILLLTALPLQQWLSNFRTNNQQFQMLRYDYGENLLKSAPRNAILFSEGDEDFFSLFYFRYVEHQRPDVQVIPPFTLFETWGVTELEHSHPELGLTASSIDFPNHFARVTYALSEIVVKNRDKRTCAFTYFDGAFHHYYWTRYPKVKVIPSGIELWVRSAADRNKKPLPFTDLRIRHWDDCPSNHHPSLDRIVWLYNRLGLVPPLP
ncbi:MAG: glycosyltransferase family 117 protein [bacterium]